MEDTLQVKLSPETIQSIAKCVVDLISKKEETAICFDSDGNEKQYTIKEVVAKTKKGRLTIYSHINKGLLVASKRGKSFLISHSNLQKYLNNE